MTKTKPSQTLKSKRLILVLVIASGLSFASGYISQRLDLASQILPSQLPERTSSGLPLKVPAFPELPLSRYKELGPILPALAYVNGREIPQLGFVTELDTEQVFSGLEKALGSDYQVTIPQSLGPQLPRLPVMIAWPQRNVAEDSKRHPLDLSGGPEKLFEGAYVISLLKLPEAGTVGAVYKMDDLAALLMRSQQNPENYKFLGELETRKYFSMSLTVRDQALENHLIVSPMDLDESWRHIEPLLVKKSYRIQHKTLSLGRNIDGVASPGSNTLELIAEKAGRTLHIVLSESAEFAGRSILNVHETMPLSESEYFRPNRKQFVKSF